MLKQLIFLLSIASIAMHAAESLSILNSKKHSPQELLTKNPDVIYLSGPHSEEKNQELQDLLKESYPYSYELLHESAISFLIVSKHPIKNPQLNPLSEKECFLDFLIAQDNNVLAHFYVTELSPSSNEEARTFFLGEILKKMESDLPFNQVPMVLCGDLKIDANSNEIGAYFIQHCFGSTPASKDTNYTLLLQSYPSNPHCPLHHNHRIESSWDEASKGFFSTITMGSTVHIAKTRCDRRINDRQVNFVLCGNSKNNSNSNQGHGRVEVEANTDWKSGDKSIEVDYVYKGRTESGNSYDVSAGGSSTWSRDGKRSGEAHAKVSVDIP